VTDHYASNHSQVVCLTNLAVYFLGQCGGQVETIKTEAPHLVFLDVMMPKMDGFNVCQTVKKKLLMQGVYIVMLTAKGQEFDKQRGEKVEADIYMTKPFDPDELLDLARRILGLS
jgi:two-component system alkaline phosphatase synthesis response regulator PhoP